MYEDIQYRKDGGVATITLNRPKVLNAIRQTTLDDLVAAFRDASNDEEIGVVVLTGAGKSFCSGGDINMEADLDSASGKRLSESGLLLSTVMRNLGKPIIAAVRGYCVGGGNELNMLCDLTIAEESAKFGQTGPRVGSVPVWYGTQMLALTAGDKKAREIVYLCRTYDAKAAEAMGLVNKVVKDGDLDKEVGAWCKELLAKSPQALRVAKLSFNHISDLLYPSVVGGMTMLSFLHGTEEFKEGMNAFLEKRAPEFRAKKTKKKA